MRYSTVGELTAEGFLVIREPFDWFPEHLAVQSPVEWDDNQGERFDSCFGDPVVWSR